MCSHNCPVWASTGGKVDVITALYLDASIYFNYYYT